MNVSELIDILQEQDGKRMVILARDAEGNGFSPITDATEEFYEPETPAHGEVIQPEDPDDTAALPALVLWPMA